MKIRKSFDIRENINTEKFSYYFKAYTFYMNDICLRDIFYKLIYVFKCVQSVLMFFALVGHSSKIKIQFCVDFKKERKLITKKDYYYYLL